MLLGLFNILPIFPYIIMAKQNLPPYIARSPNLIIDLVQDSKGGDTIECIGPEN